MKYQRSQDEASLGGTHYIQELRTISLDTYRLLTMKNLIIGLLTIFTNEIIAQNKNTVFYDSVGQETTFERHWAQVVSGRYKSIYNKSANTKTLVKTTKEDFEAELKKTDKRITKTYKLGTEFPDFDVFDLEGNRLAKQALKGKVIVLNFWFIGCAPCEMERPSLNDLTKLYAGNDDVIFLSFARNNKEQLEKFLYDYPIRYKVIATEKDYIKSNFEINGYPTNIIIGKDGRYFYNSTASGIGILNILQREIEKALKE